MFRIYIDQAIDFLYHFSMVGELSPKQSRKGAASPPLPLLSARERATVWKIGIANLFGIYKAA